MFKVGYRTSTVLDFSFRVGFVLVVLSLIPLSASSSKFFKATTQAEFLKGDVENLSIDGQGRLTLGPATELIYETSAPFLWSLVGGPDGSLFVGTGNEGKVFRIDQQGKGSVFFDAPELEVHALAPAPDGLYVATSPDGRIYKVDREGKDTVFFDPEDKYIWSLAVDAKGNVFAGTGDKGVIYKIAPDGKGSRFYETKATHATALAFDRMGNLLVGTESPGRVVRIDEQGKGFVVLDSPYDEIRALHFDDKGMLYAAALSGRPPGGAQTPTSDERISTPVSEQPRTPVPSVTAEITSIAVVDVSSGSPTTTTAARDTRRQAKGAIYRIAPDGVWDQVWELRDDAPYDLQIAPDGGLIVGTGNRQDLPAGGRPCAPDPPCSCQRTTSHRVLQGQSWPDVLRIGESRKGVQAVVRTRDKRHVESQPHDAQMVSTWGALSWHGSAASGSQIELFTRSGNTETPDETWSPWSSAYKSAAGSSITSPKARYLQWRAVLTGTGDGPVLTSIIAAYLQRNLRPQVTSITLHPPGIVFQKPFTTGEPDLAGFDDQTTPDRKLTSAAMSAQTGSASPALGRRTYQKGLQTIVWKADDDNEDDLIYDVLYRREGETNWKVLRRGVTDPILVWDTTTVPNGTYFIRIVASDSPSNAAGLALIGEFDSTALEVDNTSACDHDPERQVRRGRTSISSM